MNILFISFLMGSFWGQINDQKAPEPQPPQVIEAPKEVYRVMKSYVGEVTAYSSREEETDNTPFITANGSNVAWGIIATNAYPFGTQVRFPELYGDQIFVVKDRMHSRYESRLDIWFPDHIRATKFGLKKTKIEIVKLNTPETLSLNTK